MITSTDSLLSSLRQFVDFIDGDQDLIDQFAHDPAGTLRRHDLDMEFPEHSGYRSLGELLETVPESARVTTLQSISDIASRVGPRSAGESPDMLVLVFAVANANAAANANAGANANAVANANAGANANATANTNATGYHSLTTEKPPTPVVGVSDDYGDSDVASELAKMRLSRPRQLALLKRAVLDGERMSASSGTETLVAGVTEHRVSTYDFQGRRLRVEADITDGQISVQQASFV